MASIEGVNAGTIIKSSQIDTKGGRKRIYLTRGKAPGMQLTPIKLILNLRAKWPKLHPVKGPPPWKKRSKY